MLKQKRFNDARIDTLDLLLYVNGKVHFYEKLNKKMNITPLVVHANYVIGQKAKVNLLKAVGRWLL
jgi:hypothetical protein